MDRAKDSMCKTVAKIERIAHSHHQTVAPGWIRDACKQPWQDKTVKEELSTNRLSLTLSPTGGGIHSFSLLGLTGTHDKRSNRPGTLMEVNETLPRGMPTETPQARDHRE